MSLRPRAQLFVFSGPASAPLIGPLPIVELKPLSETQMYLMEVQVLGDAKNYSIIGAMPPTLRTLCSTPLILKLALEYWVVHRRYPTQIAPLFQSWLEVSLRASQNGAAALSQRRSGLTLIAERSATRPLTTGEALSLFKENGIGTNTFDELHQSSAIRISGNLVEVQHEGLADYLRAQSIAAMPAADRLEAILAVPLEKSSFFPVLLMAVLPSHEAQRALWARLSSGRIDVYFDALRYRYDTSHQLPVHDREALSAQYLDDLAEGIEMPLAGFFPAMHDAVIDELLMDRLAALAITGHVSANALVYKLHVQEAGQNKVTVAHPEPPGIIRAVDMNVAEYRIDSARLLGMTLLEKSIMRALELQDVEGGPIWAEERTIGRVRFLAEHYKLSLSITDDLDAIEEILLPQKDKWALNQPIQPTVRFRIASLLDDLAVLRAYGFTRLTPFWLAAGFGDDPAAAPDEAFAKTLDEQYRRYQQVYMEIVRRSFPVLLESVSMARMFPVRWKLTTSPSPRTGITIYESWVPVKDWKDAGADVEFAASPPPSEDWEVARNGLLALGRPGYVFHTGGWTRYFKHNGMSPLGRYNGATAITDEVLRWLKFDLERLFDPLPGSDGSFAAI